MRRKPAESTTDGPWKFITNLLKRGYEMFMPLHPTDTTIAADTPVLTEKDYTAIRTAKTAHLTLKGMSEELNISQTDLMGYIIEWFFMADGGFEVLKENLGTILELKAKYPLLLRSIAGS